MSKAITQAKINKAATDWNKAEAAEADAIGSKYVAQRKALEGAGLVGSKIEGNKSILEHAEDVDRFIEAAKITRAASKTFVRNLAAAPDGALDMAYVAKCAVESPEKTSNAVTGAVAALRKANEWTKARVDLTMGEIKAKVEKRDAALRKSKEERKGMTEADKAIADAKAMRERLEKRAEKIAPSPELDAVLSALKTLEAATLQPAEKKATPAATNAAVAETVEALTSGKAEPSVEDMMNMMMAFMKAKS